MKKTTHMLGLFATSITLLFTGAHTASAAEVDLGPLKPLIGTWKTQDVGVDVAPGKIDSTVGKGGAAVEPFYEVRTFEVAADATNASDQNLIAVYYKQEVFRKKDDVKFHDQRGYLIYDKEKQMVYNTFCIPRATCVVAEGKAGSKMTLEAPQRGIAESTFMHDNATTQAFSMTINIEPDTLTYSQNTKVSIYGKDYPHTDSAILKKVM